MSVNERVATNVAIYNNIQQVWGSEGDQLTVHRLDER